MSDRTISRAYDNGPAADWARRHIRDRVEIRPLFGSRVGRIAIYLLLFSPSAGFFVLGLVGMALGGGESSSSYAAFVFAFLLLFPCGVIALVGAYVRRSVARSLDAEGVNMPFGPKLEWRKLYYVDHVTRRYRAGGASRKINDNQIELVFEGGKAVIPPLIHDRAAIWTLVNAVPAEVRDDGVARSYDPYRT